MIKELQNIGFDEWFAEQLKSIDNNGQSLATTLKGKISKIDQSIDSYKKEIITINTTMKNNSTNISSVRKQQQSQHKAASVAVKNNEVLKNQAIDEIRALELEYEERRKKAAEEQSEDNDGGL